MAIGLCFRSSICQTLPRQWSAKSRGRGARRAHRAFIMAEMKPPPDGDKRSAKADDGTQYPTLMVTHRPLRRGGGRAIYGATAIALRLPSWTQIGLGARGGVTIR